METEKHAGPGSLDLPDGKPGKFDLVLINIGVYGGVVFAEGLVITAVDRGDGELPLELGIAFGVLSVPALLFFVIALAFVPEALPRWRKRLLALAGSVALIGGWLLALIVAAIGVDGTAWRIWLLVLVGVVAYGFVSLVPQPD